MAEKTPYEYRAVKFFVDDCTDILNREMNEIGAEGWRMTGVGPSNNEGYFKVFFMREKLSTDVFGRLFHDYP